MKPVNVGREPDDPVEHALWQFASLANRNALHVYDWDRFYGFIALAHENKKSWDRDDVRKLLRKYQFNEDFVQELGDAYWHGLCALEKRRRIEFGNREPVG
ncbi:MAG: hypothetical protein ACE5H2_00285 [Terriglobia bacterium]